MLAHAIPIEVCCAVGLVIPAALVTWVAIWVHRNKHDLSGEKYGSARRASTKRGFEVIYKPPEEEESRE